MTQQDVIDLGQRAVWAMLQISAPVLLVALAIGVVIALFQALTQMQEMTLTFVPKIIAILIALVALAPFMLQVLQDFTLELVDRIVAV